MRCFNREIREVGLAGISSQDESSQKRENVLEGVKSGIVRELLELREMLP